MALDPHEFARTLERLRLSKSQSKEKAAVFIGIGLRQYRRWTSQNPPTPRLSSVERVADAYEVDAGELISEIAHADGSLSARLERLETQAAETAQSVHQILQLLRDEMLPALDAQHDQAPQTTARTSRAKDRPGRAS